MVLHLKQKPGSSPSSRVRNGSQVPVPRWAGRDQVPEREQAWSLGLSRVSPALGAEDFWLTAARNVLKLVVKSEWKSYSIQAEEEEAPGKCCGYLYSPGHLSSHQSLIHPSIHLYIDPGLFLFPFLFFPFLFLSF